MLSALGLRGSLGGLVNGYVEYFRNGAYGKACLAGEVEAVIAKDLAVCFQSVPIDENDAEGGDDLFTPDEKLQILSDLDAVAAVGVPQTGF